MVAANSANSHAVTLSHCHTVTGVCPNVTDVTDVTNVTAVTPDVRCRLSLGDELVKLHNW